MVIPRGGKSSTYVYGNPNGSNSWIVIAHAA